ncbi:hypothetical protein [Jidongwangia harbinensis]|uniref:hypothetical protein n=1 Tax=Jidongwangia harbinensis TaxID=2878561 RepID=UPI001CDA0C90|nr:hypothetical protein [Jidongwangia harbinensis]MCA2215620.1 hypothetical protein [Jidongwangia harbinensis]
MGLFIIVLMSIATVLLIRNMNKRLRRLPDSFVDVDAARRNEEIARLDAAIEQPAAGAGAAVIEPSRSSKSGDGADSQVSDVAGGDQPAPGDRGDERA